MGSCCHGSSGSHKSKKTDNRFKWWSFGGFAVIVALLWAFDGNPLVEQLAPAILFGVILTWFVVLVVRRVRAGR